MLGAETVVLRALCAPSHAVRTHVTETREADNRCVITSPFCRSTRCLTVGRPPSWDGFDHISGGGARLLRPPRASWPPKQFQGRFPTPRGPWRVSRACDPHQRIQQHLRSARRLVHASGLAMEQVRHGAHVEPWMRLGFVLHRIPMGVAGNGRESSQLETLNRYLALTDRHRMSWRRRCKRLGVETNFCLGRLPWRPHYWLPNPWPTPPRCWPDPPQHR